VSNQLDIQHEPIYDTVTIAANAAVNNVSAVGFINPQSSTKTIAATSMTTSGRLDAPQAMSIQSIKIRWSESILPSDLLSVVNGFAFVLTVGIKSLNTAPIWQYPAGGGVYVPSQVATTQTAAGTAAVVTYLNNGVPTREAQLRLALPIVIGNQLNFSCTLQGTSLTLAASGSGGLGLTLQYVFDGLHARAVQ
jgi:hypothetical protein